MISPDLASIHTEYGTPDVLRIRDIERPVPGDQEIPVRVVATAMKKIPINIILSIFLLTISRSLTAQVNISDSLPSDVDKLKIIFRNSEWLGIQKFIIEGFATGKSKNGIQSSSVNNDYGIGGSRTKYNFSVSITSESLGNVVAKGKVESYEFYETPTRGEEMWSDFKSSILGFESETIPGRLSFYKVVNGAITNSTAADEENIWQIELRWMDHKAIDRSEDSFLRNGERKIFIVQPPPIQAGDENFTYEINPQRFDFVEEGRSLGSVEYSDENIIILRKELDLSLKLTLIAAMISLRE